MVNPFSSITANVEAMERFQINIKQKISEYTMSCAYEVFYFMSNHLTSSREMWILCVF